MDNRLDKFTFEELQTMYVGTQRGFRGCSLLSAQQIEQAVLQFNDELEKEVTKRRETLVSEIERTTPRYETCNQRIEK